MKIKIVAIVLGAALSQLVWAAGGSDLFDAVRAGDSTRVRVLLKSAADANGRDDIGATPLMYAAALPRQDCLRVLLDGGADVNASTTKGSTALMWATGNPATVQLLLDRGATVNAKAKDGTTALLTATLRGSAEVVKLLLGHGADPKAGGDGTDLLKASYAPPLLGLKPSPEIIRLFAEAGIELKRSDQLGPDGLFAGLGSPAILRKILDAGADPNAMLPAPAQTLPVIELSVSVGELDFTRILLERGASPNAKSSRGITSLMVAAAADHPDPTLVRLLIDKGADVNARDTSGRTVLDWALTQGENEIVRLLRGANAKSGPAPPPPPSPIAQPRSVRAAVEAAIPRLQPIGPVFSKHTGCISCHNQSLPEVAVRYARARRVPVDEGTAAHSAKATLDLWRAQRENLMLGRETGIGGFIENTTYGLWALAEDDVAADPATDAVVSRIAALQTSDGSWREIDTRPPLGGISSVVFTAMAIRGLGVYSPPGGREETKNRIARGRDYLRTAAAADTQEECFKLLGLLWSGASAAEISRQSQRVQALQRNDGGWGQLPSMISDSYSTGQALYALRAASLSSKAGAYQKGVAYLLRTQLDDGTWFMHSRALPIQAYFDSGFPHGTDQFISAAGTSWAVIALAGDL
jgi:ankyrin repeat protein